MEDAWRRAWAGCKARGGLGRGVVGSALLDAQLDPRDVGTHHRKPGLDEMLTSFDFEPVMYANIPQATYDYTAHGDGGEHTLRRAIVGGPSTVRERLEQFVAETGLDEVIVTANIYDHSARLHSYEIVADVMGVAR